jgi:SnoaL-like protein
MAATTPEQIHRLFEEAFNAGDLDALMELYEPSAALIAQPGSVAHGNEQMRAALQGFLALKGRITLETKLVSPLATWPIWPTPGRSMAPGRTATRWSWVPRPPRWRGVRPTAPGVM